MFKKIKITGFIFVFSLLFTGCLGFGDPFEEKHALSNCLANAKNNGQLQSCYEEEQAKSEQEDPEAPSA